MQIAVLHSKQFRSACSKFPTGVTVIIVLGAEKEPYGITLNFLYKCLSRSSAGPCLHRPSIANTKRHFFKQQRLCW